MKHWSYLGEGGLNWIKGVELTCSLCLLRGWERALVFLGSRELVVLG